MIAFTVTLITFYIQTKGLGVDTLHHTTEYYEMLVDRMKMQNEVDKMKLISRYADIIISVFTGLVAVVFTPIFKTVGEFFANKTKLILKHKFKKHGKSKEVVQE